MTIDSLSPEAFQDQMGVSRETLGRLILYQNLLTQWNARINLVGPASLPDFWRRHVLDSAQLVAHLPTVAGVRRIVDLGSGAGFPGLVLAILGAGDVHLIEADQRKAVFLREAARATGTAVTVHAQRVESMVAFENNVVTARAFAPLPRLLDLAAPFFAAAQDRGIPPFGLFLKGENADSELEAARKKWRFEAKKFASLSHSSAVVLGINPQGIVGTNL